MQMKKFFFGALAIFFSALNFSGLADIFDQSVQKYADKGERDPETNGNGCGRVQKPKV
jgi:hypothetical protein